MSDPNDALPLVRAAIPDAWPPRAPTFPRSPCAEHCSEEHVHVGPPLGLKGMDTRWCNGKQPMRRPADFLEQVEEECRRLRSRGFLQYRHEAGYLTRVWLTGQNPEDTP